MPVPSLSVENSVAPSPTKVHLTNAVLQWIMVLFVLGATVYMAIVNNKFDIIFNLCTLCFGYYFGQRDTSSTIR